MATAYAALVSLINVLTRVQHPTCPADFSISQIRSLFQKVSMVIEFAETYSTCINKDLQREITDAADAAQDRIESYVVLKIHQRSASKRVDQVLFRLSGMRYAFLRSDLKKTIKRMDLIIQKFMEVRQGKGEMNQQQRSAVQVGSSLPPTGTIEVLGYVEKLHRMLEQLAMYQPSREIIPVVGMGGIGKSTLARSVYNHPYIRDQFHVKAWVTISQVYDIGTIIRPLLLEFGIHDTEDPELGNELHKYLFGRKYLIILDDIWDSRAWDVIGRFLPDNNNGSRILLTTRILDVGRSIGSCSPYDQSWDLLSKMVFGQDVCPSELKQCGKEIARSCKGLPLAIVVVGGMLKMSDSTLEYWAYVAGNIRSIISREDDAYCSKILSLSYDQLPIHLRPCFLYMATFPEDYEIRVSEITMLWAADGFLKPNVNETLEEVAIENLKDLINRNLVMVKKRDSRGHIKCLKLHDLVRDLCLREAQMERFLHVNSVLGAKESQRRFVLHHSAHMVISATAQQMRFARSFILFGKDIRLPELPFLSLLRVFWPSYGYPPEDITQLANLRLIRFISSRAVRFFRMRSSVSLLWNLETLIFDRPLGPNESYSLPCEILKLPHIKHLIFTGHEHAVTFADTCAAHSDFILSNLETLKMVIIFSNEVFRKVPNIKDLGIEIGNDVLDLRTPGLLNMIHCQKLEVLHFHGSIIFNSNDLNAVKLFPNSLTKLTLAGCFMPWDRMTTVGSLPNLEVLKLKWDAFVGEEWSSTEGEFERLKYLSIANCDDLASWRVESNSHFPCLEHLSLQYMKKLEEVPQVFGESMTLKSMRLESCKTSIYISAKEISEEQENMGNCDLIIEAVWSWYTTKEHETKLESLASDTFHVEFKK